MKNIIRRTIPSLALIASMAFFTSPALACDHGGNPGDRLAKMKEELGLDDQQSSAVKEIFSSAKEACSGEMERKEKFTCWKEQRPAIREKLEGVLTPDQLVKLDQLKEKQKEEWKKRKEQYKKGD